MGIVILIIIVVVVVFILQNRDKQTVDRLGMDSQTEIGLKETQQLDTKHSTIAPKEVTNEIREQVTVLVERKEKVRAIKVLRDATGMGLKEAKEYVDRLETNP